MTKNTDLRERPHAGNPHVRFGQGQVASGRLGRGARLCGASKLSAGAKAVLMLMFAVTACTVLAKVVGTSAKSYFLDTRCPIVALSVSCELDMTPSGLCVIIR